jgi:hypothetical protein
MILTYRNETEIAGTGPHYITPEYGQYNLSNSAAGSSSAIYYLPAADWLRGTGSVPGETWFIFDIKSSYIFQGDGPKIYPDPNDVANANGYPVSINNTQVASGGVATSTPYYQLNREGTIYQITYEGFYNFTIVDLLALPDRYIDISHANLLSSLAGAGSLIKGCFYRITDFYTCYDRPDFYMPPLSPLYTGQRIRKTNSNLVSASASVKPIVVLATSQNTISTDAWQPDYPRDTIKYDVYFTQTEIKGTLAKGRITERVDEYGNRTDYDHRDVEFIRYRHYDVGTLLMSEINGINFSTGTITTTSGDFTTDGVVSGSIILVMFPNNEVLGFKITGTITATSINFITDSSYSTTNVTSIAYTANFGVSTKHFSRFNEVYLSQKTQGDYQLFKTFSWDDEVTMAGKTQSVNNYIGNYAENFNDPNLDRFILSNNVFGVDCYSNSFGINSGNNTFGGTSSTPLYINVSLVGNFYNNTTGTKFSDNSIITSHDADYVCNQNEFGDNFFSNIIYNEFTQNTISSSFYQNQITGFVGNNIGSTFILNGRPYNMLQFWYFNEIGNRCSGVLASSFQYNKVGENCVNNDFKDSFNYNFVGNGFSSNTCLGAVQYNTFGNDVQGSTFGTNFYANVLGNLISGCDFSATGTTNEIRYNEFGNDYVSMTIKADFRWNKLGNQFYSSTIDGSNAHNNVIGNNFQNNYINSTDFSGNIIGNEFWNNIVVGPFTYNNIGNFFQGNPASGLVTDGLNDFISNTIGTYFKNNGIGLKFSYNNISDNFTSNTTSGDFVHNMIQDDFSANTVDQYFEFNQIGCSFSYNTVGIRFSNNKIGDYFFRNTIGMYFQRNEIGDFFGNDTNFGGGALDNVIDDYFQDNKIGNYFGNDGTNVDGGNLILSYFRNNKIGDNFIFNAVGDAVNSNQANFTSNIIGNDFSFNIIYDGFRNNEIGDVFLGNEIGNSTSGVCGFESNDIGNFFGINLIDIYFKNNEIGDYFGNDGSSTGIFQSIGTEFQSNHIGNYFGNDGTNTAGENDIADGFQHNTIDTHLFINTICGAGFKRNNIRKGANCNGLDFVINPATHVYANYTFIIDEYLDGTGTIVYGHYHDYNGGVPRDEFDDPIN